MNCSICLDDVTTMIFFDCHHGFCKTCIIKLIENHLQCPLCRRKLKIKEINKNINLSIEEIIKLANYGIFDEDHPTENVFNEIENINIEIDKLLVPIIKKIWSFQINTRASCQGNDDNYGYISFSNKHDLIKITDMGNIKQLISQIDIIQDEKIQIIPYDELKIADIPLNTNSLYSIRFKNCYINDIFNELK